jgi:hypothetical protein
VLLIPPPTSQICASRARIGSERKSLSTCHRCQPLAPILVVTEPADIARRQVAGLLLASWTIDV